MTLKEGFDHIENHLRSTHMNLPKTNEEELRKVLSKTVATFIRHKNPKVRLSKKIDPPEDHIKKE